MAQRSSGGSGSRTAAQRNGQGGATGGRAPRPAGGQPTSKSEAGKAAAREARQAAAARAAAGAAAGGGKAGAAKATAAKTTAGRPGGAPDPAQAPSTLWGRLMRPTPDLPDAARWFQWTTWILSLAGLGVSIYLTIEHFTSGTLAGCAENSTINCTKVTTSAQSEVFGVLPVAVLGLAFFVFMAAANSPWAWQWKAPALRWLRLGSVVVGIGFVLYLVYAELIQIKAICLYCTSVHILTFLLFVFVVFDATFRHPEPPAQHR